LKPKTWRFWKLKVVAFIKTVYFEKNCIYFLKICCFFEDLLDNIEFMVFCCFLEISSVALSLWLGFDSIEFMICFWKYKSVAVFGSMKSAINPGMGCTGCKF
jgi:hypothetical protein